MSLDDKRATQKKSQVANEEDDDSKIFPQRLMEILGEETNQDAICWLPHGRAFIIRNRSLFAEKVMPKYFSRKAKYSSFTRKLNRWNFVRVSSGPELGAYYHEFFLRDKPQLAAQMFCKNARTMLAMAASDEKPSQSAPVNSASAHADQASLFLQQRETKEQKVPTATQAPPGSFLDQQTNMQISPALLAALTKAPESDYLQSKNLHGNGSTNIRLLKMHIMQQEQANRLLLEHAMAISMEKQRSEERNKLIEDRARLLQMRQLMQLRDKQQAARNPTNPRASAA